MKVKRTFFNSRTDRLFQNYVDTNNYLFTILFDSGANLSFILRDLKKNENILSYIYKRLHKRFDNIAEIDISVLSSIEYNLMKQSNIPSVIKIC
jgi:hypothetical protein|tara:strand:- start:255 stop:536 length:282 start_codon:yes stop_codon:yes gene_type:complete